LVDLFEIQIYLRRVFRSNSFSLFTKKLCLVNKRTEPGISLLPIFYAFLSRRRVVIVGCSYPSPHSARPSATSFGEITWWSLPMATPSYQMVLSIFTAAYLSCLFLPSLEWEHLI